MKNLLKLWLIFFKVGLLTIGGGYAMLPILEKELTGTKKVMDMDEILECYSLGQSIPGVIASNTAAFIGYRLMGVWGAIACVLGVIAPSIFIITVVAMLFDVMKETVWVQKAFQGVRVIVLVLLIDSLRRMLEKVVSHRFDMVIVIVSFGLVFMNILSPVWTLVLAAVVMNIYGRRWGKL